MILLQCLFLRDCNFLDNVSGDLFALRKGRDSILALAMDTASVIVPFADQSVMLVRLASTALTGGEHEMWFCSSSTRLDIQYSCSRSKKGTVSKTLAHGYDWGRVCFFQRSVVGRNFASNCS